MLTLLQGDKELLLRNEPVRGNMERITRIDQLEFEMSQEQLSCPHIELKEKAGGLSPGRLTPP